MPKIQWSNLPPALRQHLFDRVAERKITAEDLYQLKASSPRRSSSEDKRPGARHFRVNEPRNLTIGTLIRVAHALDSRVEELENRKWKFEIGRKSRSKAIARGRNTRYYLVL